MLQTQIMLMTDQGPRTFRLTRVEGRWMLTGKRGATYVALAFPAHPDRLFLASATRVDPLGPITLVEQDGRLCQAQTFGDTGALLTHHGRPLTREVA